MKQFGWSVLFCVPALLCRSVLSQTSSSKNLEDKEALSNDASASLPLSENTKSINYHDDDDDDRLSFVCKGITEEEEQVMIKKAEIQQLKDTQEATRKLIRESEIREYEKLPWTERSPSSIRETIDIKGRLQETERRLEALLQDRSKHTGERKL